MTTSEVGTVTISISGKKQESQTAQGQSQDSTQAVWPSNSLAIATCSFFPALL